MLRVSALAIAFFAFTLNSTAGALLEAVKAGDLSAVETAISQSADVNEKTGFLTPLVAAILAGNYQMTVLLLDKGADPNLGVRANIPLFMAAGMDDAAFVQLLLEKGAASPSRESRLPEVRGTAVGRRRRRQRPHSRRIAARHSPGQASRT